MRRMYSKQQLDKMTKEAIIAGIVAGEIEVVEMPPRADASAGDILQLDSDKDPVWTGLASAIAGLDIAPDDIAATGNITGASIIEIMSGYSFTPAGADVGLTKSFVYAGVVKNGNKITFVVAFNLTRTDTAESNYFSIGTFVVPADIASKIYPTTIGGVDYVDLKEIPLLHGQTIDTKGLLYCQKGGVYLGIAGLIANINTTLTLNTTYYCRYELTLLLSDNLAQ